MVILELPAARDGIARRIVALGSCRARNPFHVLRDLGELRVCEAGMSATHTAGEALQAFEVVLGQRSLPQALNRYVYENDQSPPIDRLARTLAGGVDEFLVEISDHRQFSFGEVLLQQNFVSRQLIQPYRGALLDWFRQISRGLVPDEVCVAAALEKLASGGFPHDGAMAELLRGIRFTRPDRGEIKAWLSALMARGQGRWTVVGAITIPDQDGTIMNDRRALNADLAAACDELHAAFFDPTQLIVEFGRANVLDADGANIHEYAEAFYPALGRSMLEFIRPGGLAPHSALDGAAVTSAIADRINAELVVLHTRRLGALGPFQSGLYSHYQHLLERNLLVGQRERAVHALVTRHLPRYDGYAVMRAGLGEAAFLIAAGGRKVTAFEPNENRRAAIEHGLNHLQTQGLIEPGLMTVVRGLTPDEPPTDRVLGVGLDASEVRDEPAAAPHMQRASAFDALLIDPRLFLRLRESREEQDRLIANLAALGFNGRRDYLTDGLAWLHRGQDDHPPSADSPA